MLQRFFLIFAVLGLALASAKSYTITLFQPATVGAVQLKPGDYRVDVVDRKVVIRNGQVEATSPVSVEAGDTRYRTTTVRFENSNGTMRIQEIRLGGTSTRLLLNEPAAN